MSEFERVKLDVLGWNVLVTSWLDPQTGTWKAGAPGMMLNPANSSPPGHETREEAISRMRRELERFIRSRAAREATSER